MNMRLFWVGNPDLDLGVAVLASTTHEAKRYAWDAKVFPDDWKWVDIRAIWARKAESDGFDHRGRGYILSYEEGLAAGVYCDECETDVAEEESTDGFCDMAPQAAMC